jgi:hypothetical protein
VYLDLGQGISHPTSQVHRDPMVNELVEELKDRGAFLERALDRKSLEAERYQQIVAGLTQTNKFATQLTERAGGPGSRQKALRVRRKDRIGRCAPR